MTSHQHQHVPAPQSRPRSGATSGQAGAVGRRRPTRTAAARFGAALVTGAMAAGLLAAAPAQSSTVGGSDPAGPVQAGIVVDKVEGMPEDFFTGADVSTVLSLEESGVVFRDAAGEPADLFELLAGSGVNSVRVRVWNDPFDAEGDGYGAGNVGTERAVEIGRRATEAGMSVLVDYHYSDFWADPAKQQAPKAWVDLTPAERAAAAGDFTEQSLQAFEAAGVDVAMVQVGNETNNAVAGLSEPADRAAVFQAGSEAVRAVYPDALVAVHFTNPERAGFYASVAEELDGYGVDYDVFASSYYPFWHGTLDNLTAVLSDIATTYDKKVMVAETSWVRTLEEGDGEPNVIGVPQTAYPVSVQGQATAVRDVVQAVVDVPGGAGIGVYYWEPAWLPVGPPEAIEANRLLWEEFGSGWATPAAGEYDDTGDADAWGGSGWENQALFDYDGRALESLNVYAYARTGATAPLAVVSVEAPTLTLDEGQAVVLPSTVTATYNTGDQAEVEVAWSGAQDWVRGPGTYTVRGTTSAGPTTATVTVRARNFVLDPSFEAGGTPWTIGGTGAAVTWDDPFDGVRSLHFYSGAPYAFTATQTLTGVPAGSYVLSAAGQGDSMGGTVSLGATTATGTTGADFDLSGWREWSEPEVPVTVGADGTVTVTVAADLPAAAWGTVDLVVLGTAASSTADRSALEAALDEAGAVDRSLWTAASLARLDTVVDVGGVVMAGSTPTQADVDAVLALVEAALAGLQEAYATDVSLADVLARDGSGPEQPKKAVSTDFDLLTEAVGLVLAERPGSPVAVLADPTTPLTAFLPDDAAFVRAVDELTPGRTTNEKAAAGRLRSGLDVGQLEQLLLDHVVLDATLTSADVLAADGQTVTTAGGSALTVRVAAGTVELLGADGAVVAEVDLDRVDVNLGQVQVGHVVDRVIVTG